MDITYYFSDKKVPETQHTNYADLKKNIANGLTNEKINLLEYSYMVKFIKAKGDIVNSGWMLELLNKISDNKLLEESAKIFDIFKFQDGFLKINIDKILCGLMEMGIINEYSDDQKKALENIVMFLMDYKETAFGFYGYAGTGKTTTIVELSTYFLKKGLLKSIAYTAPTNKAVSVIKAKFRHHLKEILECRTNTYGNAYEGESIDDLIERLHKLGVNIDFITTHRLLGYKNDFDNDGDRVFIQKNDVCVKDYQMIIIDECSMLPRQMIMQIFTAIREIKKETGDNYKNIPKLIFTGDRAQLNAVNEIENILFNQNTHCGNSDHLLNTTLIDIKTMKTSIMKQVMRSRIDNIIDLCINTRQWLEGEIKTPEPRKFTGKGVYIYKNNANVEKIQSVWFKKYLKNFQNDANTLLTSNIILTWTNRQCDEYNTMVRKKIFGKKIMDKFEVGDILMLSDFYILDELGSKANKDSRFYTSEQIKIIQIEKTIKQCPKFSDGLSKSINKLKNHVILENKFGILAKNLNSNTKRNYNVWKLYVNKLNDIVTEDSIPHAITVIDDKSEKQLGDEKIYCATAIKKFRGAMLSEFKTQIKTIDKIIIRQLWREWNKIFVEPFAKVNYGCSITTHKSQSSTYSTVFIDVDDILNNNSQNEAKRCLYTALTRASNEVHLLI